MDEEEGHIEVNEKKPFRKSTNKEPKEPMFIKKIMLETALETTPPISGS